MLARENSRIGFRPDDLLPSPAHPELATPEGYLALLRTIPDGTGVAGFTNALQRHWKEHPPTQQLRELQMRPSAWIWAGPAVFLLHDTEEILTVSSWIRAHGAELPRVLQPLLGVTTRQFAVAVLFLFIGFLAAAIHGARRAREGRSSAVFLLVAGALIGNALTHLAQAALFRGYTPGIVTALFVVLPYGYLLGERLHASGLVRRRTWFAAVALGIVAQVPIALLALLAVR
ncbi:MAG TPA: HXXEE domain-containing protein [Gemmatimonadaceae bacterium]|nr:HXXEE domain-containing protein [Gemmatimonadaceae bacterium]